MLAVFDPVIPAETHHNEDLSTRLSTCYHSQTTKTGKQNLFNEHR